MARTILFSLILIALPFVTYAIYVSAVRRSEARGEAWRQAPWYWLVSSGLILSIVGTVLLISFSGSEPGSTYIPSEIKDGKIVPGRFE